MTRREQTAQKIKNFRLKVGISESEVARQLGCSQTMVSYMEDGARRPNLDLAARYIQWARNAADTHTIPLAVVPTFEDLSHLSRRSDA